jgi:hypothetical protein
MIIAAAEARNLAIKTSENVKWHVTASIAFAGSNSPEKVANVLRYALQHNANDDISGEPARRIVEKHEKDWSRQGN